jgi:secreted PhoX family phosphatase
MRLSPVLLFAACAGGKAPAESATPIPEPAPAPAPLPTLRVASVPLSAELTATVQPVAATSATLDGVELSIDYRVLRRVGDDGFGVVTSQSGEALELCGDQDFNSLLWAHDKPWLVSHFECTPGAMYVTELAQADDGALSPLGHQPVDMTALGGLWFPCAGQVTPWGTHLGSEEYEPNAAFHQEDGSFEPDPWGAWARMGSWWDDPKQANPYLYGWIPELTITDASGATEVVKHFAPGRLSHEIAYVLPDQRTVYLSDDGSATGWFLFTADRAGDLSSGTLYAAKLTQTSAEEGGRFDLSWVSLGHASDADIQPLIDARVRFDDLFVATEPAEDGSCPDGATWTGHSFGPECLTLAEPSEAVPDPATAASRLETRRYAALLGATTELEKGEGVTYDPERGIVYLSLSKQARRMEAEADLPVDDVRVAPNSCGGVYGGATAAGVVDTAGEPIRSEHVMTELHAVVSGRPIDADAGGNTCATSGIANPDNITFLPRYDLLAIGEDSKAHHNNVLWLYDVRTGAMSRALVAPRGGEITGLHWIPNLGGHGYLTVSVQHPWDEMGKDAAVPDFVTDDDTRSFTGVLGPFPPLD